MGNDHFIDFALVMDIEGLHFQPHRPDGIEFKPANDERLRIILRPTDPVEDACGHRLGLTCKVFKSLPATEELVFFVHSYNTQRIIAKVADNVSLPYKRNGEILIAEDGSYIQGFHPRRHLCPPEIVSLLEEAESNLANDANRFISMLRWRQCCDSPGEVVQSQSLFWRVGDGDYPLAPLEGGTATEGIFKGMFGIHWSETHSNDLQELWKINEISEPLGHTLLREAATLSTESPRSSILILYTALETAVKIHIGKIVPNASWLMTEVPSPPIFKILRHFIPNVHRNLGNEIDFWVKLQPLLTQVQTLTELRNKVAHTGKIPEGAGSIQEKIEVVSDFLYILDVLDGHEWAKSLVSSQLRKELSWPDPTDKRFIIKSMSVE